MAWQQKVIALVDMDCFYVQVEQRRNPSLKGVPCAVVQYNQWKGGGIIAVGYEARARGVTRHIRGDEAKVKCPEIRLVHVPEVRGKADLTRYREAGAEVLQVLCEFSNCVERASVDEAFLDITDVVQARLQRTGNEVAVDDLKNTHVIDEEDKESDEKTSDNEDESLSSEDEGKEAKGTSDDDKKPSNDKQEKEERRLKMLSSWLDHVFDEQDSMGDDADRLLAVGAVIVEEMRAAVLRETGFTCSAGIAHNKMLAKLACGLNKPNAQTILPQNKVEKLFETMPIKKIRNLGGKLGHQLIEELGVSNMGDLRSFSRLQLTNAVGEKQGNWLYSVCRGVDDEPVKDRQLPKSIGCGKNFNGNVALVTKEKVMYWLSQMCQELEERLVKDRSANKRLATSLTISASLRKASLGFSRVSRCIALQEYCTKRLAKDAFSAMQRWRDPSSEKDWIPAIVNISLAAQKFRDDDRHGNVSMVNFVVKDQPIQQTLVSDATLEQKLHASRSAEKEIPVAMNRHVNDITKYFAPGVSVSEEQKSKQEIVESRNYDSVRESRVGIDELAKVKESVEKAEQASKNDGIRSFFKRKLMESQMSERRNENRVDKVGPEQLSAKETENIACEEASASSLNGREKELHVVEDVHSWFTSDSNCVTDSVPSVEDSVTESSPRAARSNNSSYQNFADIDQEVFRELPKEIREEILSAAGQNKQATKSESTIKKFFTKQTAHNQHTISGDSKNNNTALDDNAAEPAKCEKCGKLILRDNLQEHLDYHLAIALSKQSSVNSDYKDLSGKSAATKKRSFGKSVHTGKRKKFDNSKNVKTLNDFFTKS